MFQAPIRFQSLQPGSVTLAVADSVEFEDVVRLQLSLVARLSRNRGRILRLPLYFFIYLQNAFLSLRVYLGRLCVRI